MYALSADDVLWLRHAACCRSKFPLAASLLLGTVQGKGYDDFLTTLCYAHICEPRAKQIALSAAKL